MSENIHRRDAEDAEGRMMVNDAETELLRAPAGTVGALLSGLIAGAAVIGLGAATTAAPAIVGGRVIDPAFILLAAAVASAVPAFRRRAPFTTTLLLMAAAVGFTYFLGWFVFSYANVSASVRHARNWNAIAWRRDLYLSFLAVVPWSLAGTFLDRLFSRN